MGVHVGISYYAYRKYLPYPPELTWLVNDVPAVVALGQTIAAQETAPGLSFTTGVEELERAEIPLAAGSDHLGEEPLARLPTPSATTESVV